MPQGEQHSVVKGSVATQILLSLIVFAIFIPFVNKPFNIDDPLFIWAAKHIQSDPLNFYGFNVNWYRSVESMAVITKNPPLFSYYLAIVGGAFGWSEAAMHLAVMLQIMALTLGTFRLAGQFGVPPLKATLISICTPAVMVSGTTVMCDVPMVALWVWAVSFWIDGNEASSRNNWFLFAAGLLIAAAGLTKYFGASLIPLLAAYSLVRRTPATRWLPYLMIPVGIFGLYEWLTHRMYGVGLFSDAFSFSTKTSSQIHPSMLMKSIDSLTFIGGGLIVVLFFGPFMFRRKYVFAILGGMVVIGMAAYYMNANKDTGLATSLHQAVFIMAAMVILAISVADFLKHKDHKSLLLLLWVLGVFVFASVVNWTVNERIVLPMAPAVGILISRRIKWHPGKSDWLEFSYGLVPALMFSLLVTLADYRWAGEMRNVVQRVCLFHSQKNPQTQLWFAGHWGFQYYLEQAGGIPLDFSASKVQAGDTFASPFFGADLETFPAGFFETAEELKTSPLSWMSDMSPLMDAGFYASTFGHLPYVFGPVANESYWVCDFKQNIRFAGKK